MKNVERQFRGHELEIRFEENDHGHQWWVHYFVDGLSIPRDDFMAVVALLNAEAPL